MLSRLEINNFALISNSVFEPGIGLSVITGETGAGKSLLVDAISIILGAKATKNLIRSGCDYARVEAVFDLSDIKDSEFYDLLSETGISSEDDQLIIERKISLDGKSLARINGRSVIISTLKQISSYLIDIHGQHDTQKIFDEKSHVVMLDNYGGDDISKLLSNYRDLLEEYKSTVLAIRNLSSAPDSIDKRKKYLENAIKEIEDANFASDEEEKLKERYKYLKSTVSIGEILNTLDELINGEDDNGLSTLSRLDLASKDSNKLTALNSEYEELVKAVNNLYYEADSVSGQVQKCIDALDFDENEITNIENRLGLLLDLKEKYGNSIDLINQFATDASAELKGLDDSEATLRELKKKKSQIEKELLNAASLLSECRKTFAKTMSSQIINVLHELEIPNAMFEVRFTERQKERYFSSYGTEDIEFIFSANPGESLKPLATIASGGEASRIMLAIKTILSEVDSIPTLIFDEIDTGVSGVSANQIAIKLKKISRAHQVLCVTHTAQLAASADNNYKISKSSDLISTSSYIEALDDNGKVIEVSRLLSGDSTSESIDLAKKLIDSFS